MITDFQSFRKVDMPTQPPVVSVVAIAHADLKPLPNLFLA
jgi:hypothetical protein